MGRAAFLYTKITHKLFAQQVGCVSFEFFSCILCFVLHWCPCFLFPLKFAWVCLSSTSLVNFFFFSPFFLKSFYHMYYVHHGFFSKTKSQTKDTLVNSANLQLQKKVLISKIPKSNLLKLLNMLCSFGPLVTHQL